LEKDEKKLLKRVKSGDRRAFDEIIMLYMRRAYSVAFRFTNQDEDAYDMVQDAFMRTYSNIQGYNEDYPFSTWFFRILVNNCINFIKREKRRKFVFDSWRNSNNNDFEKFENRKEVFSENPEDEYLKEERFRHLWSGINKLPEKQRDAIILYDLEGFTQQEVAEILGCPVGSVMSRIYYGRQKLKKHLKSYMEK